MSIVVGRHIEGITLNPLEYLMDDAGKEIQFETEEKAKEWLREKGFTDEDMENFSFEESEPELTDEQVARIDEIHNAVYELCKVLTENPELEWDMQYIGEIADCAAETMCEAGYKVRYPAIVSEEDKPEHIEEYYGLGGGI